MEKFIELEKVSVASQGFTVLDQVDLTIPLGRTTFILGPSGCGKSTLIKVIAGLISPDAGKVLVMGKDYNDMNRIEARIFRNSASFVFQDGALWANQTIHNNILMPLKHHYPNIDPHEAESRIQDVLERVGYSDSTQLRPSALSTGEQKLVSFARSLTLDPQILFMDEPTSFMDEQGERRLNGILHDYALAGKTMVAVANTYNLAFRIADYLCIMNRGRVERMDTVEACVQNWPPYLVPLDRMHLQTLEERTSRGGRKQ